MCVVRCDYNQRNLDYAVWGPQCRAGMQYGDHSVVPVCSMGTIVSCRYASDRRLHKQFFNIFETNKRTQTRWLHAVDVS